MLVEVIACSLADAVVAQDAGADRVEFCLALEVGGLTPYIETIEAVGSLAPFPVVVMIRPQPGEFVGNTDHILRQIDQVLSLNLPNIELITGALTSDQRLDLAAMQAFRERAYNVPLTCHRCFDLTEDPYEALEQLIDLGYDRVLTSGQAPTALEGSAVITKLVQLSANRIEVIAGSGIRPHNVQELIQLTGVQQVHASCFQENSSSVDPFSFGVAKRVRNEQVIAFVRAAKSQND